MWLWLLCQIRDDNACLSSGDPFQLDVQLRGPFALELLAGQRQAFIGGLNVAQSRARQNHAEKAGHDGRDDRDVTDERCKRDSVRVDPLHVHRTVRLLTWGSSTG